MTIIRTWNAVADQSGRTRYLAHFEKRVIPSLRSHGGFEGAEILERDLGDRTEILVLSRWSSLEDIREFAGDELDVAIVDNDAAAMLLSFDRHVTHREVAGLWQAQPR